MKPEEAERLERCLDGLAPELEQRRHRELAASRADLRRADDDARLVRQAIRRALPVNSLATDVTSEIREALSRSPRENPAERWRGWLQGMLYQPSFRWASAVAVLAVLLTPVGYLGLGISGSADTAFEIPADYLDTGLPGATILVEVLMDEQGIENEIVWVIGSEGATL